MSNVYVTGNVFVHTSQACVVDTTAPTFGGITSLVANANGSLTASWAAATDPSTPVRYEIYLQANTSTGLFIDGTNLVAVSYGLNTTIYQDKLGNPLVAGTTYYVGIRALDSIGNESPTLTSMSATSAGVPSTSIINLLNTINTKIGTPVASVSTDIAAVKTDTSTLNTKITTTRANNLDFLDVAVSSRSTQTSVDSVKADTSGVSGIAAVKTDTANVLSRLTTTRADNLDNLDTTVSSRSTQTSVDSIKSDTSGASGIAAIKTDTANLNTKVTTTRANNLDNLDTTVSSRATQTSVNNVKSDTAGIAAVQTDTTNLNSKLTTGRANNLDNLDTTVSSRATQSSVDAVQNNTSFVGQVPSPLLLPESGSKDYVIYARLFNDAGHPTDPTSNLLNLRIATPDGTVIVPTTAMTKTGTGQYSFLYVVNATDTQQPLVVFFEYTVNSVSFQQIRTTEVQEFESKLDILVSRLTATRANNLDNLDTTISSRSTQTSVDSIKSDTSGVSGIAAVKTDTANLNTKLTLVRAGNLDNLDAAVSSRATQASVDSVKSDTSGVSGVAAVKTDTASLLSRLTATRATNLDYLDASISAMDLLVAAIKAKTDQLIFASGNVNANAVTNSDKTGYALTTPEKQDIVNRVLDEAAASHATAGTIGAAVGEIPAVKSQTDQLSFTSGSANAHVTSNADKTNYTLTSADKQTIVNEIWDELVSAHMGAGTMGRGIYEAAFAGISVTPTDLQNIANKVWDEPRTSHLAGGTFGESNQGLISNTRAAALDKLDANVSTRAATSDLTPLATHTDVTSARDYTIEALNDWKTMLNVGIDVATDTLVIISWLTKNDDVVLDATESSVEIQDCCGNVILNVGPDDMIGSNGVFKFTAPNASELLSRGTPYTGQVSVTRAATVYVGLTPITVL